MLYPQKCCINYVSFSTQLAEDVDECGVKKIRSKWEQISDKNADIMLIRIDKSLHKDEITAGTYEGGTMQQDITIAHTKVVNGEVAVDYKTDERSITVPNGNGTFTANDGNKFFTHFANGYSKWSAKAPEGVPAYVCYLFSCKTFLTKNRGNIMEKCYYEIREVKEMEIKKRELLAKERRMPIVEPMSDGIRLRDIGLMDSGSMNISNLSVDAKQQAGQHNYCSPRSNSRGQIEGIGIGIEL